jgi:hypothetical protein
MDAEAGLFVKTWSVGETSAVGQRDGAPGTKVIRTLDDNRIRGSAADLDFGIVPYA